MVPFIVLVVSFAFFCIIGLLNPLLMDWQTSLRIAVALMFLVTASAHWGKRRPDLIKMVPPVLPNPKFIVSITGVLEIICSIGIVIPFTSNITSICLAILLVVMFPANFHAANKNVKIAGKPTMPLLQRTILQIIFIIAVIVAGYPFNSTL
ncbi:DoxX family protein [Bacillus solimangrovi]|uniref:DoxX family protein n=1 Tax=Bacillus solimangrovi TaxID=1305675 RepID=A0A1E5LK76_9BACI|nr:DoxX family membrane protein [Bacillus solimangrovi]OEH94436.1 hypothetical protein BFG57_08215 [Bacillus solimangrovi]